MITCYPSFLALVLFVHTGPSLRSLEEQASDKSLSSISSVHPVPKKYEEKAAVKSSSSISSEPPIPKKYVQN